MSTIETVELLTIAEAAEVLRVSKATAYRLARAGDLPAHRIGGSIRIERDEMLAALSLRPGRAHDPEAAA